MSKEDTPASYIKKIHIVNRNEVPEVVYLAPSEVVWDSVSSIINGEFNSKGVSGQLYADGTCVFGEVQSHADLNQALEEEHDRITHLRKQALSQWLGQFELQFGLGDSLGVATVTGKTPGDLHRVLTDIEKIQMPGKALSTLQIGTLRDKLLYIGPYKSMTLADILGHERIRTNGFHWTKPTIMSDDKIVWNSDMGVIASSSSHTVALGTLGISKEDSNFFRATRKPSQNFRDIILLNSGTDESEVRKFAELLAEQNGMDLSVKLVPIGHDKDSNYVPRSISEWIGDL